MGDNQQHDFHEAVNIVSLPDGNISDFEEDPDQEKELDPDENVNSFPLEIEMERCNPMDGAATTLSIDLMKGPAATNDQLNGPAVTISTD